MKFRTSYVNWCRINQKNTNFFLIVVLQKNEFFARGVASPNVLRRPSPPRTPRTPRTPPLLSLREVWRTASLRGRSPILCRLSRPLPSARCNLATPPSIQPAQTSEMKGNNSMQLLHIIDNHQFRKKSTWTRDSCDSMGPCLCPLHFRQPPPRPRPRCSTSSRILLLSSLLTSIGICLLKTLRRSLKVTSMRRLPLLRLALLRLTLLRLTLLHSHYFQVKDNRQLRKRTLP